MIISNLYKTFSDSQTGVRTTVLQDFSLTIDPGTIMVIAGPSGCGKTTLLQIVAGLADSDGGTVQRDVSEQGRVSYLFQEPRLLPWRNAFSNVELALRSSEHDSHVRHEKAMHFLSLVGLADQAASFPAQLSGGMRQRVAIARAFAHPSSLILMDEPFQSLDVKLRHELLNAFLRLWNDDRRTTLYVTHDVAEAVYAADMVCRLDGPPAQVADLFAIEVPRTQRIPGNPMLLSYEGRLYDGLVTDPGQRTS